MSALKIFLITGFVLLFVATATVGYVWVKLQEVLATEVQENLLEEASESNQ
jgi:hypothetical protein